LLSDSERAITRSLGPFSNLKRKTLRIFRIDNLSVGMDPSLLNEGPQAVWIVGERARRRLPQAAHDPVDWLLMIAWNCRSRSRGLSAHDRLGSVLAIAWITHLRLLPRALVDASIAI
jgi:hypothetical protein